MKSGISLIALCLFLCFSSVSFGKYSLRTNGLNAPSSHDTSFFQIKLPAINMSSFSNPSISFLDPKVEHSQNRYNDEYGSSSVFPSLLSAVYLFSSICFIFCLKGLSNHETSRRGNMLGWVGILAAITVTFTQVSFSFRYELFFGIVFPAVVLGLYIAQMVDMIQMPQLVALFHSFVGLAALFVGFSKFHSEQFVSSDIHIIHLIELYLGTFIGTLTFIGSLVAAGKLSGVLESKSLNLKGKKLINSICLCILLILGYHFLMNEFFLSKAFCLYISFVVELFLGFHLTASIGGADMPVVLSLLNSYSGFATTISGFLLSNSLLIISGSLIGSSGAILSYIMSRGMNRDILNIVFGGWDEEEEEDEEEEVSQIENGGDIKKRKMKQNITSISANSVADELIHSKRVVIVPGYGVAVSKCQRELAEISNILKQRGIEVVFAIHPVAGRMPGHLNVLLAEANIPYHMVKEMKEVNPTISNSDVVLIVGANDTVNPSSLDPSSKIYGMPVIEAWKSKKVVVIKRTMSTGYSSIENPLFYYPNTSMLFGDAKFTTSQILTVLSDYAAPAGVAEITEENKTIMIQRASEIFTISSSDSSDSIVEYIQEEFPKYRRIIGLVTDSDKTEQAEMSETNLTLVPVTPKFIPKLRQMGFKVLVEKNIGSSILITDEEYVKYGAEIDTKENILKQSNILLKVDPPKKDFIGSIPNNTVCISYLWPGINRDILQELVRNYQKKNITYLAIDEVPRSSRAQKLDIRSSMSNLQGYRAVIEAFFNLPKFSKSSTTAAGKINPAKVFVIGAGVAGLQAIITSKSMGAIVYAYDPREDTEEEVKSCGGIFIRVPKIEQSHAGKEKEVYAKEMNEEHIKMERAIFSKIIKKCDIIICTASIPGKKSPKLVTTEMIQMMKPGSVAVDLSTEFGDRENNWGGNIQCSVANKNVIVQGVRILGRDKIERNMPIQASELFSMNLINLLEEMGGGLQFNVDMNNDIVKSMVVVKDGEILYSEEKKIQQEAVKSESVFISQKEDIFYQEMGVGSTKQEVKVKRIFGFATLQELISSDMFFLLGLIATVLFFCFLGTILNTSDIHHLFLFALASIVGYYCVWSVTPSLHTPLMSVTNALSGIIIIGSMVEYGTGLKDISTILSIIATFLAALNLSGGFYVTKRMLDMFSK